MRDKLKILGKKTKGLAVGLYCRAKARLFKRQDTLPVVRKLRRRLTAVFLVITSLVLAAGLLLSLQTTLTQFDAAAQANFGSEAIGAVYEILYNQDAEAVRDNLEALERSSSSVVFLDADYESVEFTPQTQTKSDRQELYWRALDEVFRSDMEWEDDSAMAILGSVEITPEVMATIEAIETGEWDSFVQERAAMDEAELVEDYGQFNGENVIITERGTAVIVGDNDYFASGQVNGYAYQPIEDTASSEDSVAAEEGTVAFTITVGGEYLFSKADTDGVVVQGEAGETYRVAYVDVLYEDGESAEQDRAYQLLMLQSHDVSRGEYISIILSYISIFLGGFFVLFIMSRLLARLVTKPTAQSLQEQAEFIAAASHELKSPLTVMRTSLSAARVAETGEESDKYHTNAEREAERMSRLVNDLLLLAGGDAGSWKLQRERVDMDTLLIELDGQFAPVAKRAENTLLLRLPDAPLGEVHGDEDRLRQILSVLLDNALQYAPAGTGVVIAAKKHRGRITVDVIDHGEGIADEDKARVFERFYRADASRSDKSHFGLGLSVARELAELHGGSLTLRDTDGGGATFRLTLPAAGEPS